MNVNRGIHKLMLAKKLTVKELAARLSYTTEQQLHSIVVEQVIEPSETQFKEICNALDVPEIVIQYLGTDIRDIPEEKREVYRLLAPSIEALLLEVFKDDDDGE